MLKHLGFQWIYNFGTRMREIKAEGFLTSRRERIRGGRYEQEERVMSGTS